MANKRNLTVVKVPYSTLYAVAWEGGGELPDKLKGQYTTHAEAKIAIQAWMATSRPEEHVALMKKDDENRAQK